MIEEDRMTGKTSRIVLSAALALSQGKKVLVVTHNSQMARHITRMVRDCLKSIGLQHCLRLTGDRLEFMGNGSLQCVSREFSTRIRGCSYDEFHSDVGQLTNDELMQIAPMIRTQHAVDIDITHFETEFEDEFDPYGGLRDLNIEIPGFDGSDVVEEPVKEPGHARRTLSSRR